MGYIRMLLKDRAGPLSPEQRRLLEEADKSCGRISALIAEMSDLAHLELGDAPFQQQPVDVAAIVREAAEGAATGPDIATVRLIDAGEAGQVSGDASRLRAAFAALVRCVQRELPTASSIVVQRSARPDAAIVAVGEEGAIAALLDAAEGGPTFDELRGGMGLSLPLARRVIERHGGRLLVLAARPKAGVAVVLPVRKP
jgi:signal transduction histidine kinase